MVIRTGWLVFFLTFFFGVLHGRAEEVRFATHFKRSVYFVVPVQAALEKGFWKEQGLQMKWFPFDSAATMVSAVAAGEVDTGTHGLDTMLTAISRGVPEVMVADPNMRLTFHFWVLSGSKIKSPPDFKGTKVGISRFGTSPARLGEIAVKALGLEKEVKFVALGGGLPLLAAFRASRVDALALSNFDMASFKAKGEVREVLNLMEFVPEGPGRQILYGHRDFVAKNQEAAKKAIKGFLQGGQFVMKNPDWTMARMKADFGFDDAGARGTFPMLVYGSDGRIDKKKVENTIKFLVDYGLVPRDKAPPLDRTYVEGLAE